jgi:hypothetical protein
MIDCLSVQVSNPLVALQVLVALALAGCFSLHRNGQVSVSEFIVTAIYLHMSTGTASLAGVKFPLTPTHSYECTGLRKWL